MRISIGPNIGPIRISHTVYDSPPPTPTPTPTPTPPGYGDLPRTFPTSVAIVAAFVLPIYYALALFYLAVYAPLTIAFAALIDTVLIPATVPLQRTAHPYRPLAARTASTLYLARRRPFPPPPTGYTTHFATPFTIHATRTETHYDPDPHTTTTTTHHLTRHDTYAPSRRRCALLGTLIYLALFLPWPHLITPLSEFCHAAYTVAANYISGLTTPDTPDTPSTPTN